MVLGWNEWLLSRMNGYFQEFDPVRIQALPLERMVKTGMTG